MGWVAQDMLKETIHMVIFLYEKRTGESINYRTLMKLLWDFDSITYKSRHISWTGAEYYRTRKHLVAPRGVDEYLAELDSSNKIEISIYKGDDDKIFITSIADPYHEHFVDVPTTNNLYRVIDENDTTQGSYNFIVNHTEPDEHVPLYVTYAVGNEGEVTPEVRKWARKIINSMEDNNG